MLPRSRACGAGEGLALDRGQVGVRSRRAPPTPPPAPEARAYQEAEGVLDLLKHVRVLGLAGRLGPQRQEALCGGRGGRPGDRGQRQREGAPQRD